MKRLDPDDERFRGRVSQGRRNRRQGSWVRSSLVCGPFAEEMQRDPERRERYKRSKLSLTALGRDVLAGREDFSRHNPVHRWGGGTELTNDRQWRWDAATQALIAP